ncbi:MAG: insulinase family protein [Gemmatimonadaceae bacterium]|nr:insulinase family protein [Gemmatimonadaceae bacterium]
MERRMAPAGIAGAVVGLAFLVATASAAHDPSARGGLSSPATAASAAGSLRDPALIVGRLPNGLTYYLRANAAPAHRAQLWLAVNTGSVLEDEDQQGFAHFLEHMAFNGTTHFPRGAVIDFLENSGMRFGADVNARTSFDETVYTLTVPTDDPRILSQGLQVLQDWASGAMTIDSSEVVAERGVVMGEWRTRLVDTATQRIQAHYDSLWFGGSRYLTRKAIGDTALLTHAEPGPIRRFYHDWYRPDLMAVIVVGDFDVAAMRREIEQRFGAIPARPRPRARVNHVIPSSDAPVIDIYRGRVPPRISLYWPAPTRPADVKAAVRQQLVQQLLFEDIQQRLLRIREQPSRPFIAATVEQGRLVRPLALVGVSLVTWPDSLARGLRTVLTQLEQVAQHGVPEATLAHRKAVLLSRLEHAAAGAGARSSKAYADAYVRHYLTGEGSLLSAEQELALARQILPTITPKVLAEAARFWRRGAGERVFVRIPEFAHIRVPTRADIQALMDSVAHTPLPPERAEAVAASPLLAHPPTPGHIVRETRDTVAGITEWTLSNGARVILKPTRNDPDEFLMRAWSPGGWSVVPDTLFFSPGRMVAQLMTQAGGVGTMSRDALEQQLATTGLRAFKVDIGYADESIDLAGSPKELETLFQLLYLQFTAPKLDTAALAGWQSAGNHPGAGFSLDDQLNQLFARGNPRLLPVTTNLAELVTVENAMAVYRNRFGNAGDFTFIFVGAVTPEEVRPLVERYVASLPSTAEREQPRDPRVAPFVTRVERLVNTLPVPKAQTLLVFDGPIPTAPDAYLRANQEISYIAAVLRDRLRVRLREELAGTYGVQLSTYTYALPEERYRIGASFVAAPERMRELNRELMRIVDSLRTYGASAAELARAATIARRMHETQLQANGYWMRTIGTYARLGIPLDRIPDPYGSHEVTPAELTDAVRRYLPDDFYIHFTAMPRDTSQVSTR